MYINLLYNSHNIIKLKRLFNTYLQIHHYYNQGRFSFWPYSPPLAVHPVINLQPNSKKKNKLTVFSSSYWMESTNTNASTTTSATTSATTNAAAASSTNRAPGVYAFEADYLPTEAIAMDTSFFRWFGKNVVEKVITLLFIIIIVKICKLIARFLKFLIYFV